MFRQIASRGQSAVRNIVPALTSKNQLSTSARLMSRKEETDEEFDARYEAFFNHPEIDGWQIRRGLNDLHGHDCVPEPPIIIAALKACRRVNDIALAIRALEAIKFKCGPYEKEFWPYITQEITPTLKDLGIPLPEELGYDKPELALRDVYEL